MNLSFYQRFTSLSLMLFAIAVWSACGKSISPASYTAPTPPDTTGTANTPPPPPAKKWVVTTLAGSGVAGYADADTTQAEFKNPFGIAVNKSGIVYVTDELNNRVRKLVYQ